uniref:Uncharacterized protein n=2 Tax=Eutreptiella gymnastica TaxID=73025 RepID=A0A7S1NKR4_9EUGL|mmetsp:Transcript_45332/g.81049  ORF Transcript_45332/g.81049 Transcript_45332/m.81049 type:complete len:867 (+) Transcript_45332:49-2649(+)
MGNKALKQIEDGLTSPHEDEVRTSCNTLVELLRTSPTKDVNWPWLMHLMGELLAKNMGQYKSIIYTEEFHASLRAMTKLPRKVVKRDNFQAILRHNLTVRILLGMFTAETAAQAQFFIATLETLMGTSVENDDALDCAPASVDGKPADFCGLYFEQWRRLLKSVLQHEREWREKEGGMSAGMSVSRQSMGRTGPRAPAPLALLRGPIQYYQSNECLGFAIFLFHSFISREPSGQEAAVCLSVLHDYMACFSAETLGMNAAVVLGCTGPKRDERPAEPIPHVSSTYIPRMAELLYTLALKNLRRPHSIPISKQSLACFPFFSHVFSDTDRVLQLLDTCIPAYSNTTAANGSIMHSPFDHELHLCLRILRAHLLTTTLSSEHWWHAMMTMCAVFLSFRGHLLAEFYHPKDPVSADPLGESLNGLSMSNTSPRKTQTFSTTDSVSPSSPMSSVSSPFYRAGALSPLDSAGALREWTKVMTLALKCLHVLLVQPAAADSEAHSRLVCRLIAFLFINSKEEFNPMMVDCLQIVALKWENTDTFRSLCKAIVDELLHNLTLGSVLRHTASSPVRGGGLRMLKLFKADLKMWPLQLSPLTAFPDFAGVEVLDQDLTPQTSFASWLLSNPSLTPFAKTVVGHKAQLFGHVPPDDSDQEDADTELRKLAWAPETTAPMHLLQFEGFSSDFRIGGWNTAMSQEHEKRTMPDEQDFAAGDTLCETLGYLAFLHFQWQSQPQSCVLDRYYVRADGSCKVVIPSSLLHHASTYQPLLDQASNVLTHMTQHLINKLSRFLGLSRGGSVALSCLNGLFRQYNSSHLMCYIHREVLCSVVENIGEDQVKVRAETDSVKRAIRQVEGQSQERLESMESNPTFV